MYTPTALLTLTLLASASIATAFPTEYNDRDVESLQSREPEPIPEFEIDMSQFEDRDIGVLQARAARIMIGMPAEQADCPASNNGRYGNYPARTYTAKQVKVAMMEGARLANIGKQVGDRKLRTLSTAYVSQLS